MLRQEVRPAENARLVFKEEDPAFSLCRSSSFWVCFVSSFGVSLFFFVPRSLMRESVSWFAYMWLWSPRAFSLLSLWGIVCPASWIFRHVNSRPCPNTLGQKKKRKISSLACLSVKQTAAIFRFNNLIDHINQWCEVFWGIFPPLPFSPLISRLIFGNAVTSQTFSLRASFVKQPERWWWLDFPDFGSQEEVGFSHFSHQPAALPAAQ